MWVELAVAPAAESVDGPTTRRQFDWRHAGIGGELVTTLEPADVTGVADELTGQNRTHAVEVGEGGPRCLNGLDPLMRRLQLPVKPLHVVEQFEGQLMAGVLNRVAPGP